MDPLDGHVLVSFGVKSAEDVAVGAAADALLDVVPIVDRDQTVFALKLGLPLNLARDPPNQALV